MKFFHKIFLISFIFLSIIVFKYQAFETDSESEDYKVSELLQKDESYPSQILKNFDLDVNSLGENDEIKNQQKRQTRNKGNKPKKSKRPGKPPLNKKKPNKGGKIKPNKGRKKPILPRKKPIPPRKKPIPPKKEPETVVPTNPESFKPEPLKPERKKITKPQSKDEFGKMKEDLYEQINKLRQSHHANPLNINPEIANAVQKYANGFNKNMNNIIFYDGPLAELFYYSLPGQVVNPLGKWAGNVGIFDFQYPEQNDNNEDFTQLIWKATTDIGCAFSDDSGTTFVICRLSPKGNIKGQFAENVVPV